MQYLYIFIGGAVGALLRYLLTYINHTTEFPTGTFIANIFGAFLMGLIGTMAIKYFRNNPLLKKGITTGFLGAFTTFSTFQFELVSFLEQQAYLLMVLYALSSYILGIIVCSIGVRMGARLS
ncbi:fluoride efflux transporter CrcB [Staphylococcus equorum]|uniref:Fluoride-specific ion channel FluC n=1 Tax=Staphylococcus equorum TaxID=246432 RepID=A0A9X4R2P3_9STAP|nr:fluoride efflux transporter CrcB [Staphylococcus equorum]MDG0844133.1 fluoride efflux transporter CrcB [Staphylococcus equorum]MDG0860445.1 fluoride efflux transporter CrcB [Staphylococcus equorum]